MQYTINQLAKLAGVSVRTLHFYDAKGLLKPSHVRPNGYRVYEEKELLLLQQILFFRELDFSIDEIGKIMGKKDFDMRAALAEHRKLIELKRSRLAGLLQTIDITIKKMDNKKDIQDGELYDSFSEDQMNQYKEEAKARWGNTDAWKQSQERTKNWTKEDYARVRAGGESLMHEIAANMNKGATSKDVQNLIDKHYNALRTFYEPNLELYRGLADMYVADPRFAAYFQKFHKNLPEFMQGAMHVYCEQNKK